MSPLEKGGLFWNNKGMADKTVPIPTEQFRQKIGNKAKGKALGKLIDAKNQERKRDRKRRFKDDLSSIGKYHEKRLTKNTKYFFLGKFGR